MVCKQSLLRVIANCCMSQAGLFAQLPQSRLGETEQSRCSVFVDLVS